MKDSRETLTLKEIESLCKAYMECRLSVLEESELEYVLMNLPLSSPLLEETRRLMSISHGLKFRSEDERAIRFKRLASRWLYGVACCIVIVTGCYYAFGNLRMQADYECIAYISGEKITGQVAEDIVRADIARMQDFIRTVDAKMASEEDKVNQFMNHNTTSE